MTTTPAGATSISLREMENSPPPAAATMTLWALTGLVAALISWAMLAQLDIVATAPGKLVPASLVKVVQASEAGIVREIRVRDGDLVKAGQLLVRMDATISTADAASIDRDFALRRITVAAIDATFADRAAVPDDEDPPALFAEVVQQFTARRLALNDAVALEHRAAERARAERHGAVQLREKLERSLPVISNVADSYARLQKEGFVGELLAAEKAREFMERQQDLKAQQAAVLALDAAIAQTQMRVAQLRSGFRSQLLTERVEAQAALERLQQERQKLSFRSKQLEVRAPADGVVQDMVTLISGTVVHAGAPLLNLVPQGDEMRVEAVLANEDVGFVEVGQTARIKLAAYPFQKYGTLEGKVTQLSADSIDQQASARAMGGHPMAAPALAYKALIALSAQHLPLPDGGELKIAPGMAVTAEIHQGRRSVMEYLLSPVKRVGSEAGRER